jgi:3-deoxy-manno-octulosonate cytidylyltransferase (CMP-KDO synthetase)
MKIVGIIPARYQSSRFPGKPLVEIHGKPMIQLVYERARQAEELDHLVVATDDQRILDAVRAFGGDALLTRRDHPSGTDRLAEASKILDLQHEDIVVNIQGDEPLVQPVMIQRMVEALKQQALDCLMSTLAFESHDEADYRNPNVVKVVVDHRWRALYFSRSPLPFYRETGAEFSFLKHLGFYAYRQEFLTFFTTLSPGRLENLEKLEQLRALEHGYSIRVALSPSDTVGIDTPEDLEQLVRQIEPPP